MRKAVLFTGLLLAVLAVCSLGQEITGSILGTVLDSTGAAVPGATVTITNTDRNAVIRTTTTSGNGDYTAPLLPVGHYSVAVESKGFKKSIQGGIELNVNDKLTINFSLEVGEVQQEVTVAANSIQVELQTATAQNLISGTQVRELALNTRNYEQLVRLMPGVVFTGLGDQLYQGVTNPFSGASNQVAFAMNGGRTSQNNWTIDGADNIDRGANLTLLNYPSVDAIEEFNVLRGEYNAEFGRNASGMINVITKSGTNQLHGDAYEFFRNDKLAANNFFNNRGSVNLGPDGKAQVPPLRYNNFGYTVGGPVYIPKVYNGKNHTFFFFSEEFRRVITYPSFQGTLPTADEKRGIFPSPVCVVSSGGTCTQTSATIANIDPVAQAYIKDIWSKVPDAPANNILNFALRSVFNARQELYRVDHVFNEKWAVFGRFINDSIPTIEPRGLFTASALPGVSDTTTNSPGKGFVARLTGNMTPTTLNEVGYAYSYGAVLSDPTGLDVSANSPDIKLNLPFPVTLGRIPTLSFPAGTIGAVTGYGPYRDYSRNHNWFDNFSKMKGKHTIKAGVTIIHYNKAENDARANVGSFSFASTPRPTGTTATQQAFANFLLGNVSSFGQSARDVTPDLFVNQTELYVQDDYRIRRNLTLNVGARYSIFRQAYDGKGFLNNFDPTLYSAAKAPGIDASGNLVPGTGDPLNGIFVAAKNSPYGDKVTNENYGDIAPRFGFSWDPFGDGKTAIRSGYGIAYDFSQLSNVYESPITSNPSSLRTVTYNNTTFANVTGGTPPTAAPPALAGVGIPWKTPYMQQYSFDVQRELPLRYVVDLGYFGSKGTHLIGGADINEVPPGLGVAAGLISPNTPFTSSTEPRLNQIRPYLGYNAINTIQTWYNSKYNSLQFALKKPFSRNGFFGFNYTWSKFLTDSGTDVSAPMNFYNRHADYGLSPYDRTHVLTVNWSYELPWLRSRTGFLKYAVAGWQVSGIASFATGLPFNASDSSLGTDPGGLGILGPSAAGPRADQVCDPNANAPHIIAQWFNTACFKDVPIGQIRPGNASRNTIWGPGYQVWDMSAFKNFHFTESANLQFRAEFFNIFNHTNFSSIGATLGSSTYGTVTQARDPRIIQLAGKIYF
ncbi:MAG TPA: carboxypeptidase regulatory-like domain-containing protein [Bryobacteraceae bacterium]|nr:carboxypeptidase regulatory-like domain-containing protein [Bryobacteraceae bacterium]